MCRACIATALELASLTEYLRNGDKPCKYYWRHCFASPLRRLGFIVDSIIWGQYAVLATYKVYSTDACTELR